MNRTLTILTAMLLSMNLHAATYFASPKGGGDGKSYANPTTLTAGLSLLKNAGDTLYLLSGQYDLSTTNIQNLNGTASRRIVISGYEGITRGGTYSAILDFRTTTYGNRGLVVKSTTSYLHIKNLTLRYSGKNNLYNEGSYNLFENLDIYGSADTGCQMKKGGNNIIKNVDSHDNFDYETMSGTDANFGGNADGFADKQFTGEGNHYIGCRAWRNSDDGWDFFDRYSTSQTIIENCVCYQNGPAYYDMSNHPRATGVDKAWFESKVGKQMIDRYGNTITVTLDKYPCQGNGNGFKMGGNGSTHNLLIHHCLAVANNERGFDQNNNAGKMEVYNNTSYANGTNYGFTTRFGTNTLHNNISYQTKKTDSYKAQTVVANDHNSWNGIECSVNDFLSLDTLEVLAPRNGNSELNEGNLLHLAEGSRLIDAGIDVNLVYNGSAPDLGCYESPGEEHQPEPEDTIPSVQPEGTHGIAFVSVPNAAADKALLKHLRSNDSLWVVVTEAADNTVDYSEYEVIVLGSVPNSSAAGFVPLKGYDKPMLLLKPFLLKNTVWNWGTAVNTSDLSIRVTNAAHPLFRGLHFEGDEVQLFTACNTNAVTAISTWTQTEDFDFLASPVSNSSYTTVADFPIGTDCNGTILSQRLVMIGVSEYSTANLTEDGKKMIENAILYLLGIDTPMGTETTPAAQSIIKYIEHGKLYIQTGDQVFDAIGRRIDSQH